MVLIEDTRNKEGKHRNIHAYCERNNIEIQRVKLDVGDYAIPGGNVFIDTKCCLDELATNLLNRSDSCRFWREVRRAYSQGTKLIVLCECGGQYRTANDLKDWKSKWSGVSGRRLIEEIVRCERAYGVEFRLCDKRSTARIIIELLTNGGYTNAETKTTEQNGGGDAN